ncbi:ribonuclease H-like domain-containing protein [Paraphoma chrysanthemicola]|uniref:Ribonuclease H-like domain-containing protein n=1 Tax=Paraphoma chrysanthemicola TaxID=798071 RepID=A0A8K0QZR7_9PLEO|nr:ribonuclease H-like domain-containing protein [Paraphoma chrysanthemicola]
MADAADVAQNAKRPGTVKAAVESELETIRWPLTYKLQLPKQQPGQQSLYTFGFDSAQPAKKCWWSHRLYKGPNNKPVQILYSKTRADSERIARQFLDESVVGFDMEWPWNDWKRPDLQNKIGLIQLASEDKIALFHIGLHAGKTTDDIMAPSLRKIIESPDIGKLGVGVLSADFARLRRYFRLNPRGAVELSHLYRLIKFGGWKPELVSTKLVSLARLVEDQLGHPLYKGNVRTSNWSKPLSQDQINYAAGDAYAGLMLYHCMNYKRTKMRPTPPLPMHVEKYLAHRLSGVTPLHLDAVTKDGSIMTSESFFEVKMTDAAKSRKTKDKKTSPNSKAKPSAAKFPKDLTDATSQALYSELLLRRSSLAETAGVPVYRITTNPVLVALAMHRPADKNQLTAIKGIGAKQQEAYGSAWLETISLFVQANGIAVSNTTTDTEHTTDSTAALQKGAHEPPSTPDRIPRRRGHQAQDSPSSSPAFGSPVQRTPQLHTGLSFTMAETNLDEDHEDTASSYSDDSLPSLDFGTPPTILTPQLKRKRTASPCKDGALTASQRLQRMTKGQDTGPILPASSHAAATPRKNTIITNQSDVLTPRTKLARNKLSAFSKMVTNKLPPRAVGAPPIVSERTLSLIVVRAPQTLDDLERIPGIDGLMLACQQTDTDLLKNILKFAAVRT